VCLATANLPASLTVNSLFPQSPRRTYFFLWRLCLYGATGYGWIWMRRRLLARESGTEARRRLLRAEVAGVAGIVALEASLLMQAA